MKKLFLLVALISFGFAANASKYIVDDAAVETVLNSGVEIMSVDAEATQFLNDGLAFSSATQVEPVVAFLLSWFFGYLGVHRVYLGSGTKMIVLYIITCGGIFGILPIVDTILLLIGLINGDISKYEGNTKFIMW